MHFYFKYHPSLAKSLVNIRKGIDIGSSGGYILCEPSIINEMHYKFVNKNTEIIDIPDELLNFLLVEQPIEKEQEVKQKR